MARKNHERWEDGADLMGEFAVRHRIGVLQGLQDDEDRRIAAETAQEQQGDGHPEEEDQQGLEAELEAELEEVL